MGSQSGRDRGGNSDCSTLCQTSADCPSWPSGRIANNAESQKASSVISSVSGKCTTCGLLQKRQSIVQSNSSVATQRMRIACQPALAVLFEFTGRPDIYPDCRAIVVGGKFACPKQSIGDLRRPTHRHDDVLRRAFPFGVLAVIQRRDEFGRNDTNQSVSSTDRLCRGVICRRAKSPSRRPIVQRHPPVFHFGMQSDLNRLVRAPGLGVLN